LKINSSFFDGDAPIDAEEDMNGEKEIKRNRIRVGCVSLPSSTRLPFIIFPSAWARVCAAKEKQEEVEWNRISGQVEDFTA
jgi:hypothetical protein